MQDFVHQPYQSDIASYVHPNSKSFRSNVYGSGWGLEVVGTPEDSIIP